jgi:hypothetical protein
MAFNASHLNSKYTMKTKILFLISFALIAFVSSCKKDVETPVTTSEDDSFDDVKSTTVTPGMSYVFSDKEVDFCGTPFETKFRDYGKVLILNDLDSVYIKIFLSNGKLLKSAFIYFDDIRNVPIGTKGVPQYKAFTNVCKISRPLPSVATFALPRNGNTCNALFIKLATIEIVNDTTFIKDSWFVDGTLYKATSVPYINYCYQKCCTFNPSESYDLFDTEKKIIGNVLIDNNNNDSLYITYNVSGSINLEYLQFSLVGSDFIYNSPNFADRAKTAKFAIAKSNIGECIIFKTHAMTYSYSTAGKKTNFHKINTLNKVTGKDDTNEFCKLNCK